MRYLAHIVNKKVINISNWDGLSDLSLAGEVVEIPTREVTDGEGTTNIVPTAGIGWDYVDGEFIDNRPREEE